MRVGIRRLFAPGMIRAALLLGAVSITMISLGSDFALSQDTFQTLAVDTTSPVELVLTDPEGRRTGFDPITNTGFRDIPVSQYSKSVLCDEPEYSNCQAPYKSLWVNDQMDGQYSVEAIGTGTGDFIVYVTINDEATREGITHLYSGTTAPGRVSQFTFPGRLNVFAAFGVTLKINPASNSFDVNGTFTLGPRGTVSPSTQPVSIELDDLVFTIPSGFFKEAQQGTFVFAGVIQGVQLAAELTPTGGQSYTFQVRGANVSSGLPSANPVWVHFAVGSNGGSISRNANFAP